MVTEKQKYLSVFWRTVGVSLYAPLGTIFFQALVFKKSIFAGHLYLSVLTFLLGCILVAIGYIMLDER